MNKLPNTRGIMPKFTQKELIPEILLKTICCSCETGCNSLKCGCRKHGLKCTNLCSNCHGSENCSNIEKETYEEVNDSEDIVDEEPTQSGSNVGEEEGDNHEDFEDLLESEMFDESNDEEMPSKRQKLMDK
ncbi:jg4096 [Pararge aegeria aegeria]|uniref:Jg4096 protein n=1 Tax=Pararge aegeria aegeria TaxID=348720 RepID=A0A8S4RT08_9NEOP|nr:jg4096 [Pararge aegeria aegeria]